MVVFSSDLKDFQEYYECADPTDKAWRESLIECMNDTIAELDRLVSTFLSKNSLGE